MRDLLKPILVVLAIPVLVTALSLTGRNDWESRWQRTLVRQLAAQRMQPDARVLARYSLATLCADARTSPRLPPCRTYRGYGSFIRLAAACAAAGVLFLGGLVVAGWFSRSRASAAARWFRPTLLFAAWGTGLLALANSILAVAGGLALWLYLTGDALEGDALSFVLVAGMPAAAWGIGVLASALSVTRRPSITIVGRRLAPDEQRLLFEETQNVAERVGARQPDHVVACLAPLLAVSEIDVACLDGRLSGRTLCVSLPLARILSVEEFRALVAHECAHFGGPEDGLARRGSPFLAGALSGLDHLRRQGRGIRRLVVWPALEILSFFLSVVRPSGTPAAERELEADRVAAAAFGSLELGSALVKTHAFSPAWFAVAGAMFDAVAAGSQYVNASQLFQEAVLWNSEPERFRGIARERQGHPTDSHPALGVRLGALALDPAEVAQVALVTAPARPAVDLFARSQDLEQSLSASEQQLIAATGGEALRPAGRA